MRRVKKKRKVDIKILGWSKPKTSKVFNTPKASEVPWRPVLRKSPKKINKYEFDIEMFVPHNSKSLE